MALAIARAIDGGSLVPLHSRRYFDPGTQHERELRKHGFRPVNTPDELLTSSEVIILAVKPQTLPDIRPHLENKCQGKCVVSILAGVTSDKLRETVGQGAAVLRVMPNTPLLCGRGAAVIAEPPSEDQAWLPDVLSLFTSSGMAEVLPESLINAATGLNGSSPAYFFRLAEAMARWGESQGIPYEQSLRLTVQSMDGAAAMMRESGDPPLELLSRVTSKGGATLAALSAFDEFGLEPMLNEALKRCMERAKELGN